MWVGESQEGLKSPLSIFLQTGCGPHVSAWRKAQIMVPRVLRVVSRVIPLLIKSRRDARINAVYRGKGTHPGSHSGVLCWALDRLRWKHIHGPITSSSCITRPSTVWRDETQPYKLIRDAFISLLDRPVTVEVESFSLLSMLTSPYHKKSGSIEG